MEKHFSSKLLIDRRKNSYTNKENMQQTERTNKATALPHKVLKRATELVAQRGASPRSAFRAEIAKLPQVRE